MSGEESDNIETVIEQNKNEIVTTLTLTKSTHEEDSLEDTYREEGVRGEKSDNIETVMG